MVRQYDETVTCVINFNSVNDVCSSCVFNSFFVYICCCAFICFAKGFEYSSLLRQYIFDILSAPVKVLFEDPIPFRSLTSVLWNLLSTFGNTFWNETPSTYNLSFFSNIKLYKSITLLETISI